MRTASHKKNYKIIESLAEIKIRLDRGNNLFYWLRNIILIVSGIKFLLDLNKFNTLFAGILIILAVYFAGWLDLNKFKLFQKEAELNTGKYNPYFRKKLGR